MQFNWTTFVFQIINFLVLVWLLKHFLYRPLLEAIARRQQGIEQQRLAAEATTTRAQALEAEYGKRLADLEHSRDAALAQLGQEMAVQRREREARLESELAERSQRQEALEAREREVFVQRTLEAAHGHAAEFATRFLERLAGPSLDAQLVDIFLEDYAALPPEQLATLATAARDPRVEATLTTARPLAAPDRERLLATLHQQLGADLAWREELDPALHSGLRIGLGPWMLEASLADELSFFLKGLPRVD